MNRDYVRRTRHRAVVALAGALALAVARTAAADPVPSFDLERLTLNPGAAGSLVLASGATLPAGRFRLSLAGHYQKDPLVLLQAGSELGSVVSSRWTGHVAAAIGITRWLEVGFQLPYVMSQKGDDLTGRGVDRPADKALGTPWGSVRLGLLSEAADHPLDVSLNVAIGLPVGDKAALTRDDKVSFIPSLGLGKTLGGLVRLGGEAGVQLRSAKRLSSGAGKDEVGRTLILGAGLMTLGETVRFELLGRGYLGLSEVPHTMEILGGLRIPFADWFELFGLAGPGFGQSPGTPEWRALVGLALQRPNEPPPPPPPVDRCAASEMKAPTDCPDLDYDGDGIKNRLDKCPTQPEDVDTFEDGDGCPDPDNDKDGILDVKDKCPLDPGEERFMGCPPPDADKDGLIDPEDKCPNEPGPKERMGCPIRDKDKDTVEDDVDNCIDEPGPVENKGCPVAQKQLIQITKEKLIIFDKVYFDTAKATIKPVSFPLLDQVARVLREHPEVKLMDVEGHTDSRGKAAYNRKLSQARSESVRDYLVGKGVETGRLNPVGYGPDRPTDNNKTAKGREANRRVEFVIKQRGE